MQEIRRELRQRTRDILAYVRMLQYIERAGGMVTLHGRTMKPLPVRQNTVHVLKAGVFLHLYNQVESTVFSALEHVVEQIRAANCKFVDLHDLWQKAWVTSFAKIEEDLAPDTRLTTALRMCTAIASEAVVDIVPNLGTGNLDDRRIEAIAKRYGIDLTLRPRVLRAVKHQVHNDLGFLGLVRERRNDLAHGHDSFADIGKNYSTTDLVRWSWATYQYLKDFLTSFNSYVAARGFQRKRPGGAQ